MNHIEINVMAILAALSGVAVLLLVLYFGQQQPQRWQRTAHWLAALILALGTTAMVPVMFGDTSAGTATLAVRYLAWSALPGVLIGSWIFVSLSRRGAR